MGVGVEKWDFRCEAKLLAQSVGEVAPGKLGQSEEDLGDPAIERRIEKITLGRVFGEKPEQVCFHASALAREITVEVSLEILR